MTQLVHYQINQPVKDNARNLSLLRQYCAKNSQKRIYSRWENIEKMSYLMAMLGFSTHVYSPTPKQRDINVKHWFGYEDDIHNVKKLIESMDKA